ncbi:hypothetical protein GCM10010307_32770 [Streptomyces vastus]|uniref:Uncharacterized protein n=1 Tax=Streptomyces vastus TaxID=285451 RepID=A0ABN3QV88_9ACTN
MEGTGEARAMPVAVMTVTMLVAVTVFVSVLILVVGVPMVLGAHKRPLSVPGSGTPRGSGLGKAHGAIMCV